MLEQLAARRTERTHQSRKWHLAQKQVRALLVLPDLLERPHARSVPMRLLGLLDLLLLSRLSALPRIALLVILFCIVARPLLRPLRGTFLCLLLLLLRGLPLRLRLLLCLPLARRRGRSRLRLVFVVVLRP